MRRRRNCVRVQCEEHFGFVIEDDEVDGRTFATVAALSGFVRSKLDS